MAASPVAAKVAGLGKRMEYIGQAQVLAGGRGAAGVCVEGRGLLCSPGIIISRSFFKITSQFPKLPQAFDKSTPS